jgi:integrase
LHMVQQWLGHSDMESTMRYLKPSRSQQVREKVNEIFARHVRSDFEFKGDFWTVMKILRSA